MRIERLTETASPSPICPHYILLFLSSFDLFSKFPVSRRSLFRAFAFIFDFFSIYFVCVFYKVLIVGSLCCAVLVILRFFFCLFCLFRVSVTLLDSVNLPTLLSECCTF